MAASRPSLMAMRLPTPAPNSSKTTISSSRTVGGTCRFVPAAAGCRAHGVCGLHSARSSQLSGATSLKLAPVRLGCQRLSVTVPTTSPIRTGMFALASRLTMPVSRGRPPGRGGPRRGELRNHLLQLEEAPRLRIGHQQVRADGGGRCGHRGGVAAANRPNPAEPVRQAQPGRHVTAQQHAQRVGLGHSRANWSVAAIRQSVSNRSTRKPSRPSPATSAAGSKSVPAVATTSRIAGRHDRRRPESAVLQGDAAAEQLVAHGRRDQRLPPHHHPPHRPQPAEDFVHRDHAGGDDERCRLLIARSSLLIGVGDCTGRCTGH